MSAVSSPAPFKRDETQCQLSFAFVAWTNSTNRNHGLNEIQ